MRLGERESGTERLIEAVAAYRAALEEPRREWLFAETRACLARECVERSTLARRDFRLLLELDGPNQPESDWVAFYASDGPVQPAADHIPFATAAPEQSKRDDGSPNSDLPEPPVRDYVRLDWVAPGQHERDHVSFDRTATRNNLVLAIGILTEREREREAVARHAVLEREVATCRVALDDCPREGVDPILSNSRES